MLENGVASLPALPGLPAKLDANLRATYVDENGEEDEDAWTTSGTDACRETLRPTDYFFDVSVFTRSTDKSFCISFVIVGVQVSKFLPNFVAKDGRLKRGSR